MLSSIAASPPWVEDQWLWNLQPLTGNENHWHVRLERPSFLSNPLNPITVRGTQPLNNKISFWTIPKF